MMRRRTRISDANATAWRSKKIKDKAASSHQDRMWKVKASCCLPGRLKMVKQRARKCGGGGRDGRRQVSVTTLCTGNAATVWQVSEGNLLRKQ